METKSLLLIVNPISGTHSKAELVPKIVERLGRSGYSVECEYTRARGDATTLARKAIDRAMDAVAVCGGDGTVNETARALCGSDIPMAIIPAGSGNGLARHIGLPSDPIAALDAVDEANIRDCDYATVNGRKFFCTFGIGFDAAVTKAFHEHSSRGLNTYVKSAFAEFHKYQPKDYILRINGREIREKAYLIACCNASQYGNNAYIAPEASITDGMLDIVILKNASHIQTMLAGLDMLTGMLSHNHQVDILRAPSVEIEQDTPSAAHIDGEPIEMPTKINVDIHPGQLKLFVDPTRKEFKPIITPINYITRDIGIAISKLFKNDNNG